MAIAPKRVIARSRSQAECAGKPKPGPGSNALDAAAPLDDRARGKEGDTRCHRLDDADRIALEAVRRLTIEDLGQFEGNDGEGSRGQRHQHVGPKPGRPRGDFPVDADDSAEEHGDQEPAQDFELRNTGGLVSECRQPLHVTLHLARGQKRKTAAMVPITSSPACGRGKGPVAEQWER